MSNTKKHLRVNIIDPDQLISVNDLQEVSNPIFFIRNSIPTPDGLLSNEIFGITKYDRENTFAYIDLHAEFINPLIYKTWCAVDKNIRACVHGTKNFKVNDKGELVEDENGSNGVAFLKKHIKEFNFRRTNSNKRDDNVDFLERQRLNKNIFFITKMITLPAFYRDVNTENGKVAVGEINELYRSLLISVRSLKESSDYGLNLSAATRGRVQETLLQIYDWFGSGTIIGGEDSGKILPGKNGLLRRAVYSKTSDSSTRVVISGADLKVEKLEDMDSDLDYSAVPLASALVNFKKFVIFHIRRIFENEFSADSLFPYMDKKSKEIIYLHPKDYQIEFSEARIDKEINRFLTGFSNRFIPVEVPTKEGITMKLRFKGNQISVDDYVAGQFDHMPIMERDLTWCDLFYIAAIESTKDKHILITRYPIDSYFNQFPTKIKIMSTMETEPMIVNGKFYSKYPKFGQENIGEDTSNRFNDTLNLSNLYLQSIGGDYDGDQVSIKGIQTIEANEELDKALKSISHYVDLGGKNVMTSNNEAIQSLYNLTLCLKANIDIMTASADIKF